MIWNSPFQSLQPKSDNNYAYDNSEFDNGPFMNNENRDLVNLDFSALQPDGRLDFAVNNQQPNAIQNHHHNTDIPVLDDLFTELNSDLNFDPLNKSEPVTLEDIERILLPQNARKPISKIK